MDLHKYRSKQYKIYSKPELNDAEIAEVMQIVKSPPVSSQEPLSGRGSIKVGQLKGIGNVILKTYIRGGLWGKFNKRIYYTHNQLYRPRIEYEGLELASAAGVLVPEPLAYIVKGNLLYTGWLLCRRIDSATNLATLSVENKDLAYQILPELSRQIELLVQNRIFHPDLHPGNILVGPDNKLYIIDFDKAAVFHGQLKKLQEIYLLRWRRAVIKHELPDFLTEYVSSVLRTKLIG